MGFDTNGDKESLIRLEEQLKSSNKNQDAIIETQREIFARIERQSRDVYEIGGDLKVFKQQVESKNNEIGGDLKVFKQQLDTKNKNIEQLETTVKTLTEFIDRLKGSIFVFKVVYPILMIIIAIISIWKK